MELTPTRKNAGPAAKAAAPPLVPSPWYVCPYCGSGDVEATAWIHVNTNEDTGSEPPSDEYYCPSCQDRISEIVRLHWTEEGSRFLVAPLVCEDGFRRLHLWMAKPHDCPGADEDGYYPDFWEVGDEDTEAEKGARLLGDPEVDAQRHYLIRALQGARLLGDPEVDAQWNAMLAQYESRFRVVTE